MYPDPTDGCPSCGTIDRNHAPDCGRREGDRRRPVDDRKFRSGSGVLYSPCESMPHPTDHRHCAHGHVQDCPDPGECELLPVEPDAARADAISAAEATALLSQMTGG